LIHDQNLRVLEQVTQIDLGYPENPVHPVKEEENA
jgi:hypothetical protein